MQFRKLWIALVVVLGWFVLGLVTGHSYDKSATVEEGEWQARPQALRRAGD